MEQFEKVNTDFFSPYSNNKKNVCRNKCYNLLYLNKCIEELKAIKGMDFLEKALLKDMGSKHNEKGNKRYIEFFNEKLNELELKRKRYL